MGTFQQMDKLTRGSLQTKAFRSSFCSNLFDSGSYDTEWDELHLHVSEGIKIKLYIWTFQDDKEAETYKKSPHEQQLDMMKFYGKEYTKQDILLYSPQQPKGRYLAFGLMLYDANPLPGVFEAFEISYPARRFVKQYMPEVYHDHWYEEAYTSVFKDLLVSLEEKISSFYLELNLETCDDSNVIELLSWVGLDSFQQYTDIETLRKLPAFLKQQHYQGSETYCKALFQFLFHEEAIFQIIQQQLFVYVKTNEDQTLEKMMQFLKQEIPMMLEPQLQVISYSYLDINAYCGITSILSSISGMDECCINQQYLL